MTYQVVTGFERDGSGVSVARINEDGSNTSMLASWNNPEYARFVAAWMGGDEVIEIAFSASGSETSALPYSEQTYADLKLPSLADIPERPPE